GSCQQLDRILFNADEYFSHNTKEKTLHIAGDSRPLKEKPSTDISIKEVRTKETNKTEIDDNYMTLSYIDSTHNHQSLSLPAVAKTCMVSIYSLLNTRLPRQVRPPCIDWTLDIMTDFTLLFGNDIRTWNSEYFSKIIDSIIRTGSTGAIVENKEIEQRLSDAIREKIVDKTTGNPLSQIKTAFDYAQLSYLTYSFYYSSDDMPAQVEQLPLGIYELLLETFVYRPTTPRVIEHGELVEQHDSEFEIEIIATPSPEEVAKLSAEEIEKNRALREELIKIIEQWGERYQGMHIVDQDADSDMANAMSKTLHAGHIVTGIIHRRLIIKRPGEIYVVLKFRGEIIAIVLADRFNNRNQVELVASATLPDYVLTPNSEGTVRGAGTAAVNALAQYLQQQGASTLFSEVISQPSARVKQKVGFNFKSEF
ncbi:GNAT family N-acetyltransferase, partial [Yersinia aleksiciae]